MNNILQETIFRIASKEDAKSINDISKMNWDILIVQNL